MVQRLSLPSFVLAVACFFLPFVEVSCQGRRLISFTGVQLVTGTSVEIPSTDKKSENKIQKVPRDSRAVVALLCCVAGCIAGFRGGRRAALFSAANAAGGIASLGALRSSLEKADIGLLREYLGVVTVSAGLGFWMVGAFCLVALAVNVFASTQAKTGETPVQQGRPSLGLGRPEG